MPMLRKFRFSNSVFANDPPVDGSSGGGGSNPTKPNPPEPETFSKDYVRELRQESASYRTRAQEAERIAKEATDKAKADLETAENKVKEAATAAEQRIIRAEMKAAAIKAGMVDLDGLKLADLSGVKLNEAGEVEGADELMAALKEAKPYLFASSQSTSQTSQKPPKKDDSKPKTAKDMTDEEWKAEKRKHGLTR